MGDICKINVKIGRGVLGGQNSALILPLSKDKIGTNLWYILICTILVTILQSAKYMWQTISQWDHSKNQAVTNPIVAAFSFALSTNPDAKSAPIRFSHYWHLSVFTPPVFSRLFNFGNVEQLHPSQFATQFYKV